MSVRRYATAITAAELIPVPFVDTWVQNRIRRHMVKQAFARRGEEVTDEVLALQAHEAYAPMKRAALWPVKAVAKKVFWFVTPVLMLRTWDQATRFGRSLELDEAA